MQQFFIEVLILFVTQFTLSIGVFFIYGFILFSIQQKIHQLYFTTIGWKGILLTGWIGTPVHELSHVIFAWLFGHKIHKVSFFSPDKEKKRLGYVTHSYKKWNIFQRLGSFFIGSAPLIIGPLVVLALTRWLEPSLLQASSLLSSSVLMELIKKPSFWLLIYVLFCISSHMAPSLEDLRGMKDGFILLSVILVITSLLFAYLSIPYTSIYEVLVSSIIQVSFVYLFALGVSLVHLGVVWGVGRWR